MKRILLTTLTLALIGLLSNLQAQEVPSAVLQGVQQDLEGAKLVKGWQKLSPESYMAGFEVPSMADARLTAIYSPDGEQQYVGYLDEEMSDQPQKVQESIQNFQDAQVLGVGFMENEGPGAIVVDLIYRGSTHILLFYSSDGEMIERRIVQ